MPGERERGRAIRQFIMEGAPRHPNQIAKLTAKEFSISRQSVNYHMAKLCEARELIKYGKTREAGYYPNRETLVQETLINNGLEEHQVWLTYIAPKLIDLPANVKEICEYGFTEMFNNAIDHSESSHIDITLQRSSVDLKLSVKDNGEGIFRRIQRLKKFQNEEEAIFELSKGKLTTDPDRHSGEGIFFTSRVFDWFAISSGDLAFSHQGHSPNDLLMRRSNGDSGTNVTMDILINSNTDLEDVFNKFADPDKDPSFHKTNIPIALSQFEQDSLVSRSQAKRILNRADKFKSVWLDFKGVSKIGQGFADEIFRVWKATHPDIELTTLNTNKKIENMIKRVENNKI